MPVSDVVGVLRSEFAGGGGMKLAIAWRPATNSALLDDPVDCAPDAIDEYESMSEPAPEPELDPDPADPAEIVQAEQEDIDEVAPATSLTSENVHGGNEATGDIEDSPNAAEDGEQEAGQLAAGPLAQAENSDVPPTEKRNSKSTFDVASERKLSRRRLAAGFATCVSKIAEDLAGWPVEGDDEWDIDALMRRTIDKRPLSACRQAVITYLAAAAAVAGLDLD